MPDDVSSRILAAATLAEQHGKEMERMVLVWPRQFGKMFVTKRLRVAGPSHWGAVAELLRGAAEMHSPLPDFQLELIACSYDSHILSSYEDACPALEAFLPLADQITRDLGDQTE